MPARLANRVALREAVSGTIRKQTRQHWIERFRSLNLPAGPVYDFLEAVEDEQVKHRALVLELTRGDGAAVKVIGSPWKLGAERPRAEPPPLLGEHSKEILEEWLDAGDHQVESVTALGPAS